MIPVRNKRHLWQRLEPSIAIFCRQMESAQQKCHAVRNIDLQSVCPGGLQPSEGRGEICPLGAAGFLLRGRRGSRANFDHLVVQLNRTNLVQQLVLMIHYRDRVTK